MSAIPGDDSLDPEEGAERAANAVFLKYLIIKGAVMAAAMLATVTFTFADYAAAILAVWRVPEWAIGFLVSFVIADVIWFFGGMWRDRKERETKVRAEIAAPPTWRENARSPKWLLGLAASVVYVACAALVLTGWLGLTVGLAVWALYVLLRIAYRLGVTKRLVPGLRGMLAFTDMDTPRDSPEI